MKRLFLYQNKTFYNKVEIPAEMILIESVFSGEYQPVDSLYILFRLTFFRSTETHSENKKSKNNSLITANNPEVKYE